MSKLVTATDALWHLHDRFQKQMEGCREDSSCDAPHMGDALDVINTLLEELDPSRYAEYRRQQHINHLETMLRIVTVAFRDPARYPPTTHQRWLAWTVTYEEELRAELQVLMEQAPQDTSHE